MLTISTTSNFLWYSKTSICLTNMEVKYAAMYIPVCIVGLIVWLGKNQPRGEIHRRIMNM